MGTLAPASNSFAAPDSQGLLLYLIFETQVEKRNMVEVTCLRAV